MIKVIISECYSWGNNAVYKLLTVKVKEAIKTGDKLQYAHKSVTYSPAGRLVAPTVVSIFKYCPKDKTDISRGIDLSISGRSYISADIDSDGKDEDRDGNEITCI